MTQDISFTEFHDINGGKVGIAISNAATNLNSSIQFCRFYNIHNEKPGSSSVRTDQVCGCGAIFLDNINISKVCYCSFLNITRKSLGQQLYVSGPKNTSSIMNLISDDLCGDSSSPIPSLYAHDACNSFSENLNSTNQNIQSTYGIYHAGMDPYRYELRFFRIIRNNLEEEATCIGITSRSSPETLNIVSYLQAQNFSNKNGIISFWTTRVEFYNCYFVSCKQKFARHMSAADFIYFNRVCFSVTKPEYANDPMIFVSNSLIVTNDPIVNVAICNNVAVATCKPDNIILSRVSNAIYVMILIYLE